jgi:hypothetical protein
MHASVLTVQNPMYLSADVGLPMIFVTFPLMLLALVPVILVEVWVAKPKLQGTFGKPAWAIGVANVVSTIFGVPLAWAVMLGLELLADKLDDRLLNHAQGPVLVVAEVILGPAWIGPPDNSHDWIVTLCGNASSDPNILCVVVPRSHHREQHGRAGMAGCAESNV